MVQVHIQLKTHNPREDFALPPWSDCQGLQKQALLVAPMVKNLSATLEAWVWSLGQTIPWRREQQPTPQFLPGESQWTEEPTRLQSVGLQSQKLLSNYTATFFRDLACWWLRQQRICLQCGRPGFDTWVGKIPYRREWLPTPVGFPGSSADKESASNAGDPSTIPGSGRSAGEGIDYPLQYCWTFLVVQLVKNPPVMRETWVGKIPWRREQLPTPEFWPGEFHGLYSPWGCNE